jgi:hypothetical protein
MPLLSQREYAKRRGVRHSAVQKAIASGRIHTVQGRIDPDAADREWAANTAGKITQPETAASGNSRGTSRAVRELYEARLRKLEWEQKSGELVAVAPINAWVASMIIRARDILLRIGPELRDRLAQETDPNRVQELLDAEHRRALRELREFEPNHA